MRTSRMAVVLLLTLVLSGGVALCQEPEPTVPIVVAPNVINVQSGGEWVTVHAEIAYSVVNDDTVELAVGTFVIPAASVFADDRGELVAKFVFADVTPLLEIGPNDLTLIGEDNDGELIPFGFDEIEVLDNSGHHDEGYHRRRGGQH